MVVVVFVLPRGCIFPPRLSSPSPKTNKSKVSSGAEKVAHRALKATVVRNSYQIKSVREAVT